MSNKMKDLYCGDIVNTLRCEDHQFQLSQAYKWYFSLPHIKKELNKVWNLGIALDGYVPEVENFKELLLWCIDKFDTMRRIIQIQRKLPISLFPSVFKSMLRILDPTMIFRNAEADVFLKEYGGGVELLESYLTSLRIDINYAQVEVSSPKYPYK
jgi:hypothetical protein